MRAPVILAEPNPATGWIGGIGVLLGHVATHWQMISEFIARDIRLKYRGTAFGYVWSLLEPLLLSLVYVVLFTLVAHKPDKTYPLQVVTGVISWGFFANAAGKAQTSLTGNATLIQQIYFPREIFGIAGVGSQLVMTALSLLVAVPFMIYLQISPTWRLIYVPAGLLLITALALGVGLGTACLNVLNRDVEHFWRFVTRAGMYLSPIMWSVESLTAAKSAALDKLLLNPIAAPITMIKDGILGLPLSISSGYVVYSCCVCVATMLFGMALFRRMEAEVVKKL